MDGGGVRSLNFSMQHGAGSTAASLTGGSSAAGDRAFMNNNRVASLSRQQLAQQRSGMAQSSVASSGTHNRANVRPMMLEASSSASSLSYGSDDVHRNNSSSCCVSDGTGKGSPRLSQELVSALFEYGNWPARSAAMTSLQQLVMLSDRRTLLSKHGATVGGGDEGTGEDLLLSALVRLLLNLMRDRNFKISKFANGLLCDVMERSGDSIEPHVNEIVGAVLELKMTAMNAAGSVARSSVAQSQNMASGGTDGGSPDGGVDKIEQARLIRKLIKSMDNTMLVLDPMLKALNTKSYACVREELLDLAITSLVEFPMSEHGSASDGACVVNGISHLLTAIDQQHLQYHQIQSDTSMGNNHHAAAAIAGVVVAPKPSNAPTTKFYDCCIEALALLYCQMGKDRMLRTIDEATRTVNVTSAAYKSIMQRLEEEDLSVKYKEEYAAAALLNNAQINNGNNNCASATGTPRKGDRELGEFAQYPTGNEGGSSSGGTITINKRFIKDIPWEVPPPSRQSRSRQGGSRSGSAHARANEHAQPTTVIASTAADPAPPNGRSAVSGNLKEDVDVLGMTENEKVSLWLPSNGTPHDEEDGADGMEGVENSHVAGREVEQASSSSPSSVPGPMSSASNGPYGIYEPLQDISSSIFQQSAVKVYSSNGSQPAQAAPPSSYGGHYHHHQRGPQDDKMPKASSPATSSLSPSSSFLAQRSKSMDAMQMGSGTTASAMSAQEGSCRPTSRTQRLLNAYSSGVSSRPVSVSATPTSTGGTGGGEGTDASIVAGKLSILKRRALSRRAISAGSVNSPREGPDAAHSGSSTSAGFRGTSVGGGTAAPSTAGGLSIDVPSPPTAPRNHATARPNAHAPPTYGGYSPTVVANETGHATKSGAGGVGARITTPKSTPALFTDSSSGHGSFGSGGSGGGSGFMTPKTQQRLRSVHEGSQPFEEISTESLLPVADDEVESVLRTTSNTLAVQAAASHMDLDWGAQYEALIELRRITVHHPSAVSRVLKSVLPSINVAVTSLRSHVSKTALMLLTEMFVFMSKPMELELDAVVPVLLKRSSLQDFLANLAKKALHEMCARCDEMRVVGTLLALFNSGKGSSSLPSATLRTAACVTMAIATERLIIRQRHKSHAAGGASAAAGSSGGNSGGRPRFGSFGGSSASSYEAMTERLFQFGVGALEESHPDGRSSGRKVLYLLFASMDTPTFESMLRRFTNDSNAKKVKQVIEHVIRNNNGGNNGGGGSSSKKGRIRNRSSSGGGSENNSGNTQQQRDRSYSTDSGDASSSQQAPAFANGAGNGAAAVHDSLSNMNDEQLMTFVSSLSRTDTMDWRKKVDALSELVDVSSSLVSRGLLSAERLATIFDHVVRRMEDGNSKVVLQALLTTSRLFPIFGDGSCIALNSLMPLLATTLSSTNDRIKQLSTSALDALIENSDPSLLLQNLTHCISHGPLRGKHVLVDRLTRIVGAVYRSKPGPIVRYALPACFSLLGNGSNFAQSVEVRHAATRLARELAHCCGRDVLLQHASSLSMTIQTKLEDILS